MNKNILNKLSRATYLTTIFILLSYTCLKIKNFLKISVNDMIGDQGRLVICTFRFMTIYEKCVGLVDKIMYLF